MSPLDHSYRHDLPTMERVRVTFNMARDAHEAACQLAIREGASLNDVFSRALEHQLVAWIEDDVECFDPMSRKSWIKPAGKKFPSRLGKFPSQTEGSHGNDDVVRTSARLDPLLLGDWQDGVWQLLHRFQYPSNAFSVAVREYIASLNI